MSDIKASERRLTAALDRIDYLLETVPVAQPVPVGSAPDEKQDQAELQALRGQLDRAQAENTRLSDALSIALASPAAPAAAAAGDDADRLSSLSNQAARLSLANEELAAANRGLIEAVAGQTDGVEAVALALEAEIEALRAARAAEIAQIADIMAELQRMLAGSAASDAPAADAERISFGDEAGVPELTREPEPAFDAVYGEEDETFAEDDDDDLGDAKRGGM